MSPRLRVHWEDGTSSPPCLELAPCLPEPLLSVPRWIFNDPDVAIAEHVSLWTLRATLQELQPRTMRVLLDRNMLMRCRPILVVEYGAARYVVDGNHRATAHALLGDISVLAFVMRIEPG